MPKRTKKSPSTCQDHLFILKPKHSFCRFGQAASVSFCDPNSVKGKTKGKKCRNCQTLDCPIFNNDRNFSTPTFILNSQKQYYEQRGLKMRQQHERKMIEYTDEKDSLNIPKPRTRNNFCSVCRQVYEDYKEHIDSEKHKKKINSSLFNKYILDAADMFNPTMKRTINFNNLTISTEAQEEEDLKYLENRPIKKVKSDETHEKCPYIQDFIKPQIAPPPHLNLNNSAYFPGLGSNVNYFPNPVNSFPIPAMAPQMTFNYNMNFFWNPYYNHQPYGMNPWMECYQQPQAISTNLPRIEQNYFFQGPTQNPYEKSFTEGYGFGLRCEEKKEIVPQRQQVIVIDDDDHQFGEKCENRV